MYTLYYEPKEVLVFDVRKSFLCIAYREVRFVPLRSSYDLRRIFVGWLVGLFTAGILSIQGMPLEGSI